MTVTVRQFFKQFPDDATCLDHLFKIRFGHDYDCPKCGSETKWYPLKKVRAYSCQWCGHHVHPTVGTPFEASRTSLQTWFYAIYLFTTTRHGVSAKELQRQLGVTYKCAWRMGHEIRKHMAEVDGEPPLSGIVEIDETFVGGKVKGSTGRAALKNKTVILGMVERGGDIITKVVPDIRRRTVMPVIKANVDEMAEVHTDELTSYRGLDEVFTKHETVTHGKGEYVRDNVHTNTIEGYWSLLKKSIGGTHVHVSKKHMEKYTKEFEYRFNSRKNPENMFPELISSFSKPSKK